MLHGDLSNHVADTIAVQCIGTLLEYQTKGIKNAVLNVIKGKEGNAKINNHVLSMMNHIYRRTDMCVDLVIFEQDYTEQLEDFLMNNCPFNRLLKVKRPAQIGSRLFTGDIAYYVDNNAETRSLINNKYCIPFSEISNIIH